MTGSLRPIAPSLTGDAASYYRILYYGYLALALIVFTFVVPPFQKNDEPSHFYRAVSITNLDFFCRKDGAGQYYTEIKRKYVDLPQVLGAEAIYFSPDAKFSPDRLRSDFSDRSYQGRVPVYYICNLAVPGYIPNALGVLAGKPFESPLVSFYLGRIAGVLFFLVCLAVSLRTVPDRYKLAVYFYAALPMVLHQVSSFSYDAVQLSLFPLIFAYLTKFLTQSEQIRLRELVLFVVLLWLTVSVKSFAYYGILLLYFVIPIAKVSRSFSGYLRVTGALAAVTALTVGLFEVIYLSRSGLVNPQGGGPIAPKEQIRFTLEHPLDFVAASYRTVEANGEGILRQGVGVFGWVGFEVNFLVIYLAVFLAGLLCYHIARNEQPLLHPGQIAVLWAAVFVTVGSLFFSLYVVWSPVGAPRVDGLQGRYFVGLLPFAMLAVAQTTTALGAARSLKLLAFLLFWLMGVSIFTAVYNRYY